MTGMGHLIPGCRAARLLTARHLVELAENPVASAG